MARIATLTAEEKLAKKKADAEKQNFKRKVKRLTERFPELSESEILNLAINGVPKKTKAEIAKAYRERHKESIKTKKAEQYQKDKEARAKAYDDKMKAMSESEREEFLRAKREYQKQYREQNPESVLKYTKKCKEKKIERNVCNMVEFLLSKVTEEGLA
ncbi:MAG: hypothetical protein ACRCXX_11610 [Cetobacterium sp.]|uniref:hypothetical protein n=1 Tax=Cetobacterium sp. TaxID=2071632 RepID=UPI003F3039E0